MYGPTELVFLTECITSASSVPGSFVEVGCGYGATTVFLNKFMNEKNIKRNYYALDTFSGFEKEHVDYEIRERGKSPKIKSMLQSTFTDNKQSWFDKTMLLNGVNRVKSIAKDATRFDFSTIAPIAFCLLDIDLYIPMKESLPKIYDVMSPGGVLIVDDCWKIDEWDGALQAYEEFIGSRCISREIVCGKLGVIRVTPESPSTVKR